MANNEDLGSLRVSLGLNDSNFTGNIPKINRQLKLIDSEFKAASSSVGGFEDSLSKLQSQSTNVEKKLQLQRVKVDELKRQYDELVRTKGADSKAAENMLIRYNKTVATMNRTEQALQSLNHEIQEQSSEWTKVSKEADQALSKISTELSAVKSEFKAATAGIQGFGNETVDLRQKSEHLEKVLGLENQAVEQLNRKYKEAVRAKGQDADETKQLLVQYNNAKARAKETESEMHRLNQTISEQSSRIGILRRRVNDTQQSFNDFGSRAQETGSNIVSSLGIATAAMGAGFGVATKKSMDFEAQLSSIKALTGASSDEMAKMRDLSMEMGAKTVYSSLEAAQAIEELLKAGLTPAQVQAGGLEQALSLATAGGLDLAKAAEIMSTALNAYKDDGMKAADASNILAGTANASATSVEELQYSLAAVSAVAAGVGMSFEDTNIALGLFANNGLKGSDAGTSLKTMLSNLSPKTKDQYNEFEALGLMSFDLQKAMKFLSDNGIKPASDDVEGASDAIRKYIMQQEGAKKWNKDCEKSFQGLGMATGFMNNAFYDTNGNLEDLDTIAGALKDSMKDLTAEQRNQALYTLFGSDAIRAGNILFKEGAKGVTEFKSAMGNVTAEEVATEKLNNLKGDIEQLKGSFETLQITVGKTVEPMVKLGVQGVQKLVDGFNNMSPGMQKVVTYSGLAATGILGIVTAGGLLLTFIGTASMGLGAITGLFGGVGIGAASAAGGIAAAGTASATAAGGVGLLGGALTIITGPIGLTVAAVAALTAGGILLYKNWDQVNASLNKNPFAKALVYMNPVTGALMGTVGAIKGVQHAMDETIPKANLFGEGISKGTQKAVGAYLKLDSNASMTLTTMFAKQQVITDQNLNSIVSKYDAMGNKILSSMDTNHKKQLEKTQKLFAQNSALSDQEEAKILAKMDKNNESKKQKVQGYEDRIKEIMTKAKNEKRALTDQERTEINTIQGKMRTVAVQTMSKSEEEQKMILGRLKTEAGNITARQAADVVKNSVEQKNKSVAEATKQYKETKKQVEYMRDVTGSITKEQANKIIKNAKEQRDESVKKAEDMNDKVVKEAKKQAKGHADQIDWETGKVKTGWDKMKEKVSDTWSWIQGIFGVKDDKKSSSKKSSSSSSKADKYALGTSRRGHGGGPAIVGERGRELAHIPGVGVTMVGENGPELIGDLPEGSSVLPNRHTEQLLKSYGFPGYEGGIGDYFDTIMQGPSAVFEKAASKFGLKDSLLPSWFTNISGSPISAIKELAKDKIQGLIDSMTDFFGGGGSYTGIGGYYLSSPFRVTTNFTPNGNKNDKVHKGGVHHGVDLAAPQGTKILSLTDGIVQQILIGSKTAGNGVRVQSGSDLLSYIHMMKAPSVKQGQKVKEGQLLGYVGSTGFSTGPHLDLKIKRNGAYINPLSYLQGKAGGGGGDSFGAAPSGNLAQWISAGMARAGVSGDAWKTGLNYIIMKESTGRPNVQGAMTSDGRAKGLMQLKHFNYKGNPFDPVNNIRWGIKYIQDRYKTIGGAVNWWKKHHWYKDGTNFHNGGNAVLGDGNEYEPYMLPNGVVGISPNQATLYPDFPTGAKVWPNITEFVKSMPSLVPSIPDLGSTISKFSNNVNATTSNSEEIALLKEQNALLAQIASKSTSFTAEVDRRVLIDFVEDALNRKMTDYLGRMGFK
ncbi:phage tail tape measure protein [Priestia aryabhattai]|uniref:phage tail tape measure protein n=1 Tax=Priestia aryabhattai TaxID=412384 RepID=UPI0023AFE58A|nr:phage tail tape measure protein [Priestia aryabhattai]MDE8676451.1 phage tail tape measure protein [Priestia aryabhattai]